jgi:hypothetical protein
VDTAFQGRRWASGKQRWTTPCRRLDPQFPIVHIATWQGGSWLGFDDIALLLCCAEASLVLVAFDRATLPWHAGQLLRAGHDYAGLVLFRGTVRSTDYSQQSRLLTGFWAREGSAWDWLNRVVYLPRSL